MFWGNGRVGRRASNFVVESIDGKTQISLPTLIECDMLPDDKSEIPSAETPSASQSCGR